MFCILINRSLASLSLSLTNLSLVHLFRCVTALPLCDRRLTHWKITFQVHYRFDLFSPALACRIYHLLQQWILRWEDKITRSCLWSEKTDRAGIQKFLNSKGENEETGAKKLTPLGARHHKISKKLRRSLIFFFPSQTDEKFHCWLYVFYYSFYSHTSQ